MKFTPEELITQIRNQISIYQHRVKSDNKAHRYNINDRAESFTVPLFKLLFDWNDLKNLNTAKTNFPGIDLGTDKYRTAIQVTSETSLEKVKDTLIKFVNNEYFDRFDRLVIFMIREKQESYSQKAINSICNDKFEFNPQKDIIALSDLIKNIKELPRGKLEEVFKLFQDETGFVDNTPALKSESVEKLNEYKEQGKNPKQSRQAIIHSFIKDNGGIIRAFYALVAGILGLVGLYQVLMGALNPPVSGTPSYPTPSITSSSTPPTPIGGGTGIIIFEAYDVENNNLEIYQLDLANPTNSLKNLTKNSFEDQDPVWSPDGTQIAFVSNRDRNSDIYIMDSDGSNQKNLTPKNGKEDLEPAWSPDGTKIAFSRFEQYYEHYKQSGIYTMDADGSSERQITTISGQDRFPVWSKDGRYIYFITSKYDKFPIRCGHCRYDLYMIEPGTLDLVGEEVENNLGFTNQASVFFADERFIYSFKESDSNQNIWIRNLDGTNGNRLTDYDGNEFGPSFSPDGKYIAFIWEKIDGSRVLMIMNLENGDSEVIIELEGLDNTSWQP